MYVHELTDNSGLLLNTLRRADELQEESRSHSKVEVRILVGGVNGNVIEKLNSCDGYACLENLHCSVDCSLDGGEGAYCCHCLCVDR